MEEHPGLLASPTRCVRYLWDVPLCHNADCQHIWKLRIVLIRLRHGAKQEWDQGLGRPLFLHDQRYLRLGNNVLGYLGAHQNGALPKRKSLRLVQCKRLLLLDLARSEHASPSLSLDRVHRHLLVSRPLRHLSRELPQLSSDLHAHKLSGLKLWLHVGRANLR